MLAKIKDRENEKYLLDVIMDHSADTILAKLFLSHDDYIYSKIDDEDVEEIREIYNNNPDAWSGLIYNPDLDTTILGDLIDMLKSGRYQYYTSDVYIKDIILPYYNHRTSFIQGTMLDFYNELVYSKDESDLIEKFIKMHRKDDKLIELDDGKKYVLTD